MRRDSALPIAVSCLLIAGTPPAQARQPLFGIVTQIDGKPLPNQRNGRALQAPDSKASGADPAETKPVETKTAAE